MAILIAMLEFDIAAMNAVIVVPMFAPRINGTDWLSRITFFATNGTTSEVVIVLERIAAVSTSPQPKHFIGLWKKNRCTPVPYVCNPSIADSTLRKKSIDPNSNANERITRMKPLSIS